MFLSLCPTKFLYVDYHCHQIPSLLQSLNKLLYRARQRGWLELDLIIGLWAEKHLETLPRDILVDFEALLLEENPDLFKWLTKQVPPPETLGKNKAFQVCMLTVM